MQFCNVKIAFLINPKSPKDNSQFYIIKRKHYIIARVAKLKIKISKIFFIEFYRISKISQDFLGFS